MANLKVVVPLLNKRRFPVADTTDKSNVVGQVNKDFQFESVAEVTNALGNWYQDRDGYFYWGGGIEKHINETQELEILTKQQLPDAIEKSLTDDPTKLNTIIDYRKLIKVTTALPGNDGDKINIAILDTGINKNHPAFNKDNILLGDIHNSWDEIIDNNGHGTHLSGLICACSKMNVGIIGLAPDVKLTIFKVLNDDGTINIEKISKALTSISNNSNIDLVNISFNVPEDDFNLIKNDIETIHNNGIIMVASAGNGKFLSSRCFYPANLSYIFSVGAVNKELLSYFKSSGFYKTVDYFFVDEQLESLSYISDIQTYGLGSCSVYTAILSGLIARILSSTPSVVERNTHIPSEFNQLGFTYNNQNTLESKRLYKTT